MEGIRDGFVGDDCFVCGLLWPGARPCVRCGSRGNYASARLMDPGVVRVRIARAYDRWEGAGDAEALAALLTEVHLDQPESLEALDELGVDLGQLRRAWQRLAPDETPDVD
jgi:methylphosphotriester-DNA--protein-cysteine methyltransferase